MQRPARTMKRQKRGEQATVITKLREDFKLWYIRGSLDILKEVVH